MADKLGKLYLKIKKNVSINMYPETLYLSSWLQKMYNLEMNVILFIFVIKIVYVFFYHYNKTQEIYIFKWCSFKMCNIKYLENFTK